MGRLLEVADFALGRRFSRHVRADAHTWEAPTLRLGRSGNRRKVNACGLNR